MMTTTMKMVLYLAINAFILLCEFEDGTCGDDDNRHENDGNGDVDNGFGRNGDVHFEAFGNDGRQSGIGCLIDFCRLFHITCA